MTTFIACVIALVSTLAFLALWFRVVYVKLKAKIDIVNSAKNQLAACRKDYMLKRDGAEGQDAKLILTRSLDIYRQSVKLYNRTLLKPYNYIPGLLMGFRKIICHSPQEENDEKRIKRAC